MGDARGETRYLCSELVKLERLGAPPVTVILDNISASGACVESEVEVREGSHVRLICGTKTFRGTVRYCVRRGDDYFVGIVFEPGSKWSKARFRPKHLLDPRKVKGHPPGKPYVT